MNPPETIKVASMLSKSPGSVLVIVAAVFGYALLQVYADLKESNRVLVDLVRSSVSESRAVADSLSLLSRRLEMENRSYYGNSDDREIPKAKIVDRKR